MIECQRSALNGLATHDTQQLNGDVFLAAVWKPDGSVLGGWLADREPTKASDADVFPRPGVCSVN